MAAGGGGGTGRRGRVRTTLASDLFGLSGEDLHRLREAEQSWTAWLEKFQDYRLLWREHGFMRFSRLADRRGSPATTAGFP